MIDKLLAKHPDLEDMLRANPSCKTYKVLSESGKIKEFWERDDNGNWNDQTEREKLREQIEAERDELERLRREAARKLAKAKKEQEEQEEQDNDRVD